jgi:hypothetical protein
MPEFYLRGIFNLFSLQNVEKAIVQLQGEEKVEKPYRQSQNPGRSWKVFVQTSENSSWSMVTYIVGLLFLNQSLQTNFLKLLL